MLDVTKSKSRKIETVKRENDALYLFSEAGTHRLAPKDARAVRVTYTCASIFSQREKPGVIMNEGFGDWSFEEDEKTVCLKTDKLCILVDKATSAYTYCDEKGNELLKDDPKQPRSMEEFLTYKLASGVEIKKEYVQTADGKKEVLRDVPRIPDEKLYHTRMNFELQENEALYGLGQQEEGFLNLRGQMVYLHQANRKIAVPVLLSSKGYGLLIDNYSPMIFSDTPYGSYIYCEAADDIDFYFINGGRMEGVVREYRHLTGKAAMLPYWSFGYVQSQERYETAQEILDTVEEFKRRNIGISCIVLDWLSWPDGQWGQKSFDTGRFPDPQAMLDRLHEMDVHFMISVWPTMAEGCPNNAEFAEKGLFLPASNVYNAFDKNGRELYWKQANEGLFRYGVDAWWCDSSEPYTLEWMHGERQEPAAMYADYCRSIANNIPAWETNAFALYHAMALYEGQRGTCPGKEGSRVINLTRSSYTGQQRYGTVLWSGDTDASWETLRKQIRTGLSFCATGLPYWTTDIGAFFVRNGNIWYWQGDYPKANEDSAYCELYVRWAEWECFLPMFRAHGTDCRREPWHFAQAGEEFYDALVKTIDLRYKLMPYIYSIAGKVWLEDASFIRMLAFDHPNDQAARECGDQYMFGDSLMVCPVTFPMYYNNDIDVTADVNISREVYLPAGGWFDQYTGEYYEGGRQITADAPLERIPVFVKDGSIIPVAIPENEEKAVIGLEIFAKNNASCVFYDDAKDGYGYENGEYRMLKLTWDRSSQKLDVTVIHDGMSGELPEFRVIRK
ncbi:MAG: glycoside hydrolase family 31 protein [Lachnospiraceae bacterium]|nr:glycoside hydrolase family 31 protein [Lachnospiraceae bacterium]